MGIFSYMRKAQYYETDQMGIIHHANYIHWFEEARVDFMEKIGFGYDRVEELGISMAVLSVKCEYKSMVRFGETMNIQISITECSATRLTVSYRVVDTVKGELRAIGETRHCYYDNKRRRPIVLKKASPELYELLLSQVDNFS